MDPCIKWGAYAYLITFHDNMKYESNVTTLSDKIKVCLANIYLL